MTEIVLSGLRADLPIGAMAAFGVLRICERQGKNARLSWRAGGSGFVAVVHLEGVDHESDLVGLLIADLREEERRNALKQWEQIKTVEGTEFAKSIGPILSQCGEKERESADWFAAMASDLSQDEGLVEATPFDMSVARQKFLSDAVKLASSLTAPTKGRNARSLDDHYREALFGPWKYEDDQHSLGWDPSTMKLGAFTHKAPTGMPNAGVKVAVWLALESLPLFPVFTVEGNQQTRAFRQRKNKAWFYWPVWGEPITLSTLKSLLAWPGLANDKLRSEAASRGLAGIYEAEKYKPNKYLASFRPPELVWVAD